MAAVLLALASSRGIADFSGGMLTRRMPLAAVTVLSQAAGFVLLLVLLGFTRGLDWHSAWIGAIGGIGGGVGLACFYAALARGTMSIVSPITACSAIVPVGGVFIYFLGRGSHGGLGALDTRWRAGRLAHAAHGVGDLVGLESESGQAARSLRGARRIGRCVGERALRAREPARADRGRLGSRLALPDRDRRSRLSRAARTDLSCPTSRSCGCSRRRRGRGRGMMTP